MVIKGCKVQIYPNPRQSQFIKKTLNASYLVYRQTYLYLEAYHQKSEMIPSSKQVARNFYLLLGEKRFSLLKEVDKNILIMTALYLRQRYEHAIKNGVAFRVKSNKAPSYSFPIPLSDEKQIILDPYKRRGFIPIEEIKSVRILGLRPFKGKILRPSISLNKLGDYFLSFCYETNEKILLTNRDEKPVGIDLGVKDIVITSEGKKYARLDFSKEKERIRHFQRRLSHKQINSQRRKKIDRKIYRYHQRIKHRQYDYLHKITYHLVKEHNMIGMETIHVNDFTRKIKKRSFRRALNNADLNEVTRQLDYKCKFYDKTLVKVNKEFPSSQRCSCCGFINSEVKNLKVREWICPRCHTTHDRDINAATNILLESQRMAKIIKAK